MFSQSVFSYGLPAALLLSASYCPTAMANSDIETLTVTGSRLGLSTAQLGVASTVLGAEEIALSGAVQLTDLLRALPGVTLTQSGGLGTFTEIRLRGSETNHLLVLIDGVVANDIGQGSTIDLSHLQASNIARIELLRGAQSAIWGSGAVAGVLSITTKAARLGGNQISATAGLGNQGTVQGGVTARGQAGKVKLSSYANYLEASGQNIALSGAEEDGYRNISTGATLRWQADPAHQFTATARLVDYATDYDAIDYVSTGLPVDAANVTDGKQYSGLASWHYTPADTAYAITLTAQYRQDSNDNVAGGRADGGTTGTRYQLTWLNRYAVAQWQLAGGLEYLARQFRQRGPLTFGDPNQRQQDHTTSVFAEVSRDLADDLTLTLSGRYDDNTEYDDAVSYRAALSWAISDAYSVFASHSQAVKTPSFTERFGYFPQTFQGNPDLQPEQSRQWEVGARWQLQQALHGQVSVFDTRLEDEIDGFAFVPDTFIGTAVNRTGTSQRRGAEAQLEWHQGPATWRATYSYVDAEQADTAELRVARHQASVSMLTALPVPNLHLYTKAAYTGSRDDQFFPPAATPQRVGLDAYTLLDINLQYQLSAHWQLALRLDNALDERYQDIVGFRAPARRWLLSIDYQL